MAEKVCIKRNQHRRPRARGNVGPNRRRSFPIDSAKPPRLPPSEVCQRGPLTAIDGKVASRPTSKNLQDSGHSLHVRTSRNHVRTADLGAKRSERLLLSAGSVGQHERPVAAVHQNASAAVQRSPKRKLPLIAFIMVHVRSVAASACFKIET